MNGHLFKLVSRKDTLLGTVMVPLHYAEVLLRRDSSGYVRFHVREPVSFWEMTQRGSDTPLMVEVATMELCWRSRHGGSKECVQIHGIAPERLESLPGFAFMPGAGYIRSLIEG